MKLVRGNYEGASQFAQFDAGPVEKLTPPQMRALLESILQLASPGGHADQRRIFAALAIAEENARAWEQ